MPPPPFTTRPLYLGRKGLLACGHYLAARAGQRMLDKGGNAIDAGVAAGFALNLLKPTLNGLGGENPILVWHAKDKKAYSVSGQGFLAKVATLDAYRKLEIDRIPGDGYLGACVPAAFGTWAFALARFGTLTLADVLEPAIGFAADGFSMYPLLRHALQGLSRRFQAEWPSSAKLYLPGAKLPKVGDLHVNADWAATMKKAAAQEAKNKKHGRAEAIMAAVDWWYKGEVAERIVEWMKTPIKDASKRKHAGLLTRDDFAAWKPTLEEPATADYRGVTVVKCGPWTQGPVFLQQLKLLEGFDLAKMGHNSPTYIHTVAEAAKLAFADRERWYGDPAFVKVPLDRLLSKEYADERRKLIDPKKASLEMRPGDGPPRKPGDVTELMEDVSDSHDHDTTHACSVDAHGNLFAATCSGGWIPSSPVIPGLGFPMGTRGQMFDLDGHRPNAPAPRKRPRTTLTPSLALKKGEPWMAFGTPGGDQQDQWTLQFFLNVVDFGMGLQEAIDAPSFHSTHFPSSFYPRKAVPGGLVCEDRISEATRKELASRGHKVTAVGPWRNGIVMAAARAGRIAERGRLASRRGRVRDGGVSDRGTAATHPASPSSSSGARNFGPLKWIMCSGASASHTSVSHAMSAMCFLNSALVAKAVTYRRRQELSLSSSSNSLRRFGDTGPCDVTASTSTSQFRSASQKTRSGNLSCPDQGRPTQRSLSSSTCQSFLAVSPR
ncbi:MAG: gamma-glutamyltransferase family protein [Gemmataceae bacterium]|nr:gamma-glutamyltransferase family protein [Gemmataceae bacterium]